MKVQEIDVKSGLEIDIDGIIGCLAGVGEKVRMAERSDGRTPVANRYDRMLACLRSSARRDSWRMILQIGRAHV